MGVGSILHYVGSATLFIAMVLTIVVDVSAPVVKNISFVDLNLPGEADVQFGVFGYCRDPGMATGHSYCSQSSIGYNPARALDGIDDTVWNDTRADGLKALTNVFVLHPVGTGVLFVAFLLSLIAGSAVGGLMAMLVSALAFIINAVVVIIDFVVFSILLDEVRQGSASGTYGAAIWIALVAAVLSLIGLVLMFVTCCAGRRRRRRHARKTMQY